MDADLVLEGGGVKGIGLVGAYAVLKGAGYTIHRVAGTSAGAVVGALIAAGTPVDELEKLMREVDYGSFQDEDFLDHLGLVGKGISVLLEKGVFEGNRLREWLDAKLGGRTFGDLRIEDPGSSLPAERRYRLVVMASDVSRGELVRLPWDYPRYGIDPDEVKVADAVRCSMSIPFFFEPVRLRFRRDGRQEISYVVDGGMLSNFPVDAFDRSDGRPPRWPTFGIKLSAKPDAAQQQRFAVRGTLDFAKAVIGTMASWHDQMHVEDPHVLARTIWVDTTGVRATDFDLDRETQERLYRNGREGALKFLKTWDWERYVQTFRSRP